MDKNSETVFWNKSSFSESFLGMSWVVEGDGAEGDVHRIFKGRWSEQLSGSRADQEWKEKAEVKGGEERHRSIIDGSSDEFGYPIRVGTPGSLRRDAREGNFLERKRGAMRLPVALVFLEPQSG